MLMINMLLVLISLIIVLALGLVLDGQLDAWAVSDA